MHVPSTAVPKCSYRVSSNEFGCAGRSVSVRCDYASIGLQAGPHGGRNLRRRFVSVALVGVLMAASFAAMGVSVLGKPNPSLGDQLGVGENDQTWTFMVYIDGDNNLQYQATYDLEEMEAVGSTDRVNIVVMMDTLDLLEGTHYYYVEQGEAAIDAEAGVNDCDCDMFDDDGKEKNMGDPATLTDFIVKSATAFPADNYVLVLWDHGGGWYGVCWDDTSVREEDGRIDRLTVHEVGTAIADAKEQLEADEIVDDFKLAMLGYDACLNGMIEVAYEVRGMADYMVASVTSIPFDGWAYDLFLRNLTADPSMSVEDLGVNIVDTYVEYYSMCLGAGVNGWGASQLSLFNVNEVVGLAGAVNALAVELVDGGYTESSSYRGALESAESQTPRIESYGEQFAFVDLGLYATLLGQKIPALSDLTDAVVEAVGLAVPYCDWVKTDSGMNLRTTGITIYFTCCWNYLYVDYAYETAEEAAAAGELIYYGMDFAIDTNWDEFLFAYSQAYEVWYP